MLLLWVAESGGQPVVDRKRISLEVDIREDVPVWVWLLARALLYNRKHALSYACVSTNYLYDFLK